MNDDELKTRIDEIAKISPENFLAMKSMVVIEEFEFRFRHRRENLRAELAEYRNVPHVDRICQKCGGSGTVVYGSTSTWRMGVGGSAMTPGVCDKCWGSGDNARPWANLKELEGKIRHYELELKRGKAQGVPVEIRDLIVEKLEAKIKLLTPRQCVAGIIYTEKGKVLIGKRREDQWQPGKWCFPGGKVEGEETLQDALIREIHEELDFKPIVLDEVHSALVAYENGTFQLTYFNCAMPQGVPARAVEFSEIKEVDLEDLPEYDLLHIDEDIATMIAVTASTNKLIKHHETIEMLLKEILIYLESPTTDSSAALNLAFMIRGQLAAKI